MSARAPANLMLVVFAPFAAGYFLLYFFRNVNAVISKDLAAEFSLAPSDLGLLTSMYLLAFAPLPSSRSGCCSTVTARGGVVAALLCVAAAGALQLRAGADFATLSIGRALIGLGVPRRGSWPRSRPLRRGSAPRASRTQRVYLAVVGGLSATAPTEALLGPFGWRALFILLCALSVLAARRWFFSSCRRSCRGRPAPRQQVAGFGGIFASAPFAHRAAAGSSAKRLPGAAGAVARPLALRRGGETRQGAANYLFVMALAYMVGPSSLAWVPTASRTACRA